MEYLVCAVSGERLPYRGGVCLAHQAGDSEKLAAGINPLTDPGRRACEARVADGDDVGSDLVPACQCRWHQFWARRSQWLLRRGPGGMELEAWLWRRFTREGRRGPAGEAGDADRARRYGHVAFALGCAALSVSALAIALVLAGCGGGPPQPSVAGCAKAIEAHPDAASFDAPSMKACHGLTSDQQVKATLIAFQNGARG